MSSKYVNYNVDPLSSTSVSAIGSMLTSMGDQKKNALAKEEMALNNAMNKEKLSLDKWKAEQDIAQANADRVAKAQEAAANRANQRAIAAADRSAQASRDNRAIARDNAEIARSAEQTAYSRGRDSANDAEAKSNRDYLKSRDTKADQEKSDQIKGELAGANAALDVPISKKVQVDDPQNAYDPDAIKTRDEGVKELKKTRDSLVTDEQINKLNLTSDEKTLLDTYNTRNAIEDPIERANAIRELALRGKSQAEIDEEDSGITSFGKGAMKLFTKLKLGEARIKEDIFASVNSLTQSDEKYRKQQNNITKNRKAEDKAIDSEFKKDDLTQDLVSRIEGIKKKDTDRLFLQEKAKGEIEALQKYKDTHGERVVPKIEVDRVFEPAETRAQGEQQIEAILTKYAEGGASPNELLYAKKALAERLNNIVERQKELKKNESDEIKRQRDKQDEIAKENRAEGRDKKTAEIKFQRDQQSQQTQHKLNMQENKNK